MQLTIDDRRASGNHGCESKDCQPVRHRAGETQIASGLSPFRVKYTLYM